MVPMEPYDETYKVPDELNLCDPEFCKCHLEKSKAVLDTEDGSSRCKNPGPLENGEYEVDHLSVCTRNHKLFRLHCKGWEAEPTVEPLIHLENCPEKVEEAIEKYNASNLKENYSLF